MVTARTADQQLGSLESPQRGYETRRPVDLSTKPAIRPTVLEVVAADRAVGSTYCHRIPYPIYYPDGAGLGGQGRTDESRVPDAAAWGPFAFGSR
jgi:hypothetical protein